MDCKWDIYRKLTLLFFPVQTILVMPNLIQAFKDLDCSKNVYWGTSAGRSKYFGDYFRGLAYGMSWPLVSKYPQDSAS